MSSTNMMVTPLRTLVAGLLALVLAGVVSPAADATGADDPFEPWAVDLTPVGREAPPTRREEQSIAEALVGYLALPNLTAVERTAAQAELASLSPAAQSAGARALGVTPVTAASGGRIGIASIPITPPASRALAVSWVQQSNSYYCGPASAYMILKFLGYSTSKFNGVALNQANLASSAHLNTDAAGATTWASKRMETGINRWSGDALYYTQVNAPSTATVTGKLVNRIGRNGQPFAADTVEMVGGYHYNNHPNRTIGHWIVASGYSGSGATSTWKDPASGLAGFENAAQTFSISTSTLTTRHLQSNGILG